MIDKNSENIKINVLGTEYTIYKRTLEEDVKLQNAIWNTKYHIIL